MNRIITLTMNPALDKCASIDHVVPNRKLRCDPPRFEPGGGGINVSRAIQRLGGESTACFPSGGAIGQVFNNLLKQEGVDMHPIPIGDMTRVNLTVIENVSRQHFRFVMPGPELTKKEWQRCLDAVTNGSAADFIVASGILPRRVPADFYARLARAAQKSNRLLIVDTSGDALKKVLKESVYLLKPNMRELAYLAGYEIEHEDQQEAIVQKIIKHGQAKIVVVSLGAAGVLYATENTLERIPAPTVKIRSRIGAGDSMVAGIVLSLAQGKPLRKAVLFGMAAGAASVMTPGSELCRRVDTERLYADISQKQVHH